MIASLLSTSSITGSLITGLVFGTSAGFSPGPLLALVLAQTLRHGRREGIKVALSPLVTDLPIILAAVFLLTRLGDAQGVLGAISIAGGFFVLYLGVETLRTRGFDSARPNEAPRSISRGIVVNALSPHPYLFWLSVGAPLMIRSWKSSPPAAVAFLAGFYGCLVGSKVFLAAAAGGSRRVLTGGAYSRVMQVLGALLLVFAVLLIRDGLRMTGIVARG